VNESMRGYQVRQIILQSGERLPILCDAKTGRPLEAPLLYALTDLRARGRSSATIRHAMEAVMLLMMALQDEGIDLNERLQSGSFLAPHEVDLVIKSAGLRFITSKATHIERDRIAISANRAASNPSFSGNEFVSRNTAAIRLLYIHSFLKWATQSQLMRMDPRSRSYEQIRSHFELVCSVLKARGPHTGIRSDFGARQGLDESGVAAMQSVLNVVPEDAHWASPHARARNILMLKWLWELGVRRGELLGVKVSDIDFRQHTVLIRRNADAKEDPRLRQPLTKTKARLLPLSGDLVDATYDYVCRERRSLPNALLHEFLFVACRSGKPLSLAAVNKVFSLLREQVDQLPKNLTPHVLRHTWNDRFSEAMDKANIGEEQEKKMRSTLMGWSETSGTAAVYTRRHVQRKAKAALKAMQNGLKFGAVKQ
jgi:site-specific recombinase XerD